MREKGITITRLANELGMSYQGVKKVYDGNAPSGFNSLNNLNAARLLGVDPEWLATGVDTGRTAAPQSVSHPNDGGHDPISAMAIDLAHLFDMIPDRISRAQAYSDCSKIILEKLTELKAGGKAS